MTRYFVLALLGLTLVGCSSSDSEGPQDIVAQATDAARAVAAADHADTLALQAAIVDARAQADKFLLTGDKKAAQLFEQTFADSLKVFDPTIANELFP